MIMAQEARFRSANTKIIKLIKDKIESTINKAITNGLFECTINIPNVNSDIIEHIKEELVESGYTVKIPNNYKRYDYVTKLDTQCDYIIISWGKLG